MTIPEFRTSQTRDMQYYICQWGQGCVSKYILKDKSLCIKVHPKYYKLFPHQVQNNLKMESFGK